MSTQLEIRNQKTQTRWLKLATYSAITLSAMFLAGSYGFGAGKSVQYKRDIATVQDFFKEHQRAVVFMTGDHRALAILKDGICVPFPQAIPQDYATVFVSPEWEPCSSKTLALYESPEHLRTKLGGLENDYPAPN